VIVRVRHPLAIVGIAAALGALAGRRAQRRLGPLAGAIVGLVGAIALRYLREAVVAEIELVVRDYRTRRASPAFADDRAAARR
jgi:hypothetical protein